LQQKTGCPKLIDCEVNVTAHKEIKTKKELKIKLMIDR
jgi:hypothetical protein